MKLIAGVESLSRLAKLVFKEGIRSRKEFSTFTKANSNILAECLWYTQGKGMPNVSALVAASFHPTEPLVLFNYTPVAHNTLFAHPTGWTVPLRLCRGIVFDSDGNLVAKGFHKFFNLGENAETKQLPDESFEATEKMDGHLGIIFEYRGKPFITTRGSFASHTSVIATEMLAKYTASPRWTAIHLNHLTVLVEIIHPDTKVLTDYNNEEKFVIIGAFNTVSLEDLPYSKLVEVGRILGLPVVQIARGRSLDDLMALMKDRSVSNQEGYVVRFESGLRVKLKFETYIAKMISNKITYAYLMKKYMSGRLKDTVELLEEEIVGAAKQMLGEILMTISIPGTAKDKWRALYELEPDGSDSFKETCRSFVRFVLTGKAGVK